MKNHSLLSDENALRRALCALVAPNYASMLASGQRSPSLKKAAEIEEALGIPASWWVRRNTERADHKLVSGKNPQKVNNMVNEAAK